MKSELSEMRPTPEQLHRGKLAQPLFIAHNDINIAIAAGATRIMEGADVAMIAAVVVAQVFAAIERAEAAMISV